MFMVKLSKIVITVVFKFIDMFSKIEITVVFKSIGNTAGS